MVTEKKLSIDWIPRGYFFYYESLYLNLVSDSVSDAEFYDTKILSRLTENKSLNPKPKIILQYVNPLY